MSRLDETFRPLATRLVAGAGAAMILRRAGPPTYDPATGEVTSANAEQAVAGVIEDVETGHSDGLVLRGDRMITLAAEPLGTEPHPGDAVLIDGAVLRVLSVSATWAGDRPALYRLHVRR